MVNANPLFLLCFEPVPRFTATVVAGMVGE
jgi:hypothetical protein